MLNEWGKFIFPFKIFIEIGWINIWSLLEIDWIKVKCDWSIDMATFLSEMLNKMDQNPESLFWWFEHPYNGCGLRKFLHAGYENVENTMNSVGDWKIRWLRTLGWIQIKILIRSRKDVSKSDRCKWSEKSSFDSNSYFWSFDVIINKWNEMIEQVRNDENNISPRSPLYFGWDVKQLRFFENFISRRSKNFLLFFE